MKAKGDQGVAWLDPGWQPTYLGFVPSEAAWNRQMKAMKLSEPWPTVPGRCWRGNEVGGDQQVILVTFNRETWMAVSPVQRLGIVIHECVHVWQFICDNAGIKNPDMETEAYAIMAITQNLLRAIQQCWGLSIDWKETTA